MKFISCSLKICSASTVQLDAKVMLLNEKNIMLQNNLSFPVDATYLNHHNAEGILEIP